jgi:hypothetical protein
MNNEWKELKYKLETPNGEYERGTTDCPRDKDVKIMSSFCACCGFFGGAFPSKEVIRCTFKPEPKAPTHEEIMTKWWKTTGNHWVKVVCYWPIKNSEIPYRIYSHPSDDNSESFVSRSWFIGKESADIPPETE